MKKIFLLGFFIAFSVMPAQASEKPFYAFYPSEVGADFKKFEHNILGFSIDVPNSWTFGINGSGSMTVALLYPETLNTAVLSNEYESIEIGVLPFNNISLNDAYDFILKGMKEAHPNLINEKEPISIKVQGNDALEFSFFWTSKNGTVVNELVHLISYKNQIRSVIVRYGQGKKDAVPTFQSIVKTYKAKDFSN